MRRILLFLTIALLISPVLGAGNWTLYFDPFAVTNWDNTINNSLFHSSSSVIFVPDHNFQSENVIIGFVIDAPDIPGSMQNFSIHIHHAGGTVESGFWNISYMYYGVDGNLVNDVRIGTVNYQEGPYLAVSTDSLGTILAYSTFNNETGLVSTISPWSALSFYPSDFLIPGYPDYKTNVFPTFTADKYITEIDVGASIPQSFSVRILWLPKNQFANVPANLIVASQNQPVTPTLPRITVAQIIQAFGFLSIFLIFLVNMEVLIATNWVWFFVIAELTIIMLAFLESGGRIFRVPGKWWRNQKKLFDFGLWGVEQLEKHYIFFIALGALSALGWFMQVSNASAALSWFSRIFGIS